MLLNDQITPKETALINCIYPFELKSWPPLMFPKSLAALVFLEFPE